MSDPNPSSARVRARRGVHACDAAPSDAERLAVLRAGLPATRAGIYLNTGTAGPLPAEAAAAMAEIADRELAVGRATRESFEELLARLDEARAVVAAVLGTGMDLVALTHSTTEGINLALGTIDWRAGDRAVTTSLEHPGVTGPLALLRDRLGVEVVEAEIGDGGDDALTLAALEAAAVGGRTRAIVASHVAWSTGALLPAAAIAALARRCGVVGILDGAQSAGAIPLAIDEIGADFYAVSGQKWLLGPEGMGALAVGRSVVVVRAAAGGRLLRRLDALRGRARRALAGRAAVRDGGPAQALDRGPGPERRLAEHVRRPALGARTGGAAGGHRGRSAGGDARGHARDTAGPDGDARLVPGGRVDGRRGRRGAGAPGPRHRPLDPRARRGPTLSVAFFTTDDELRRVLDAVEELAAHTPATLPARPAIEFLDRAPE